MQHDRRDTTKAFPIAQPSQRIPVIAFLPPPSIFDAVVMPAYLLVTLSYLLLCRALVVQQHFLFGRHMLLRKIPSWLTLFTLSGQVWK